MKHDDRPPTTSQPADDDLEFEATAVQEAEPTKGGWYVTRADGWGLFVTSEHCSDEPQPREGMICYGRGIGYPVRGITIGGRVYRYETPAEHEKSQAKMRARLKAEGEARDAAFSADAPNRPPLPVFACSDPEGWAECVRKNSQDPYSYECVRYAAAWASLMEVRIAGKTVADVAKQASSEADTSGITGFMYGCAVSMLAEFWVRGDELRHWHNLDTQIGNEGERANESDGVLNPALLGIS